MAIYTCRHCGGPIIFRRRKQLPNGTFVHTTKPFPVHIAGPCK